MRLRNWTITGLDGCGGFWHTPPPLVRGRRRFLARPRIDFGENTGESFESEGHDMKVERLLLLAVITLACTLPRAAMAQAADSPAPGAFAGAEVEPTPTSPWGWFKMPTITMPKIAMPKMPVDPLAPFKASARKVSEGSKKAWEGTKELFNIGTGRAQEPATSVASRGEAPSMWSRMFGGGEKEPEGPRSVAEFMAQPRLDP
jgi:hypothetical protein